MAMKGIITGGVITLLVAGILIGLGILIFVDLGDTLVDDYSVAVTDFNVTSLSNTTYSDLNGSGTWGCEASVSSAINATRTETLSSGNYTILDCTIIGVAGSNVDVSHIGQSIYVNYTYTYGDSTAGIAINDTANALADFTDWIPIIIIMLVVGVIFGLLAIGIYMLGGIGGTGGGTGGSVGKSGLGSGSGGYLNY